MRKLLSICLILLISLPAGAQQGFASGTQISLPYSTFANTSAWPASDDFEVLREELGLAFATGTPNYDLEVELVPETSILLLQTSSEREQSKMIPLRIVSSAPDTSDAGLVVMMDGLVVANSGSHALLLAPRAWNAAALARGLAAWGSVVQTDDGRLEITNPEFEPALHFSATFTFSGITQTGNTGTVVLRPPKIRNSNSNEHFYTLLYADGVEEILQPIVAAPQLMNALASRQLNAAFDRNLGVLTINNKSYRPSYFVAALEPATLSWLAANADSFAIAFRLEDINKDGVMDYQVIAASGSQWLFGQP